jgi:hypothetical protein
VHHGSNNQLALNYSCWHHAQAGPALRTPITDSQYFFCVAAQPLTIYHCRHALTRQHTSFDGLGRKWASWLGYHPFAVSPADTQHAEGWWLHSAAVLYTVQPAVPLTVKWLAAGRIRVDVDAAEPGHAAELATGRADVGHVLVEHIVPQRPAVVGLVACNIRLCVAACCCTRDGCRAGHRGRRAGHRRRRAGHSRGWRRRAGHWHGLQQKQHTHSSQSSKCCASAAAEVCVHVPSSGAAAAAVCRAAHGTDTIINSSRKSPFAFSAGLCLEVSAVHMCFRDPQSPCSRFPLTARCCLSPHSAGSHQGKGTAAAPVS